MVALILKMKLNGTSRSTMLKSEETCKMIIVHQYCSCKSQLVHPCTYKYSTYLKNLFYYKTTFLVNLMIRVFLLKTTFKGYIEKIKIL